MRRLMGSGMRSRDLCSILMSGESRAFLFVQVDCRENLVNKFVYWEDRVVICFS